MTHHTRVLINIAYSIILILLQIIFFSSCQEKLTCLITRTTSQASNFMTTVQWMPWKLVTVTVKLSFASLLSVTLSCLKKKMVRMLSRQYITTILYVYTHGAIQQLYRFDGHSSLRQMLHNSYVGLVYAQYQTNTAQQLC